MTTTELNAQIRKAMTRVRRLKIPERIMELLRHYEQVQTTERSDHMEVHGKLTLQIGGGPVQFYIQSYGQFHENRHFNVYQGGLKVFEAFSVGPDDCRDTDQRKVIRTKTYALVVDCFLPGIWMKLLDLKRIIREEERQKKLAEKAQAKVAKPEPVREDDADMAHRFGIRLTPRV